MNVLSTMIKLEQVLTDGVTQVEVVAKGTESDGEFIIQDEFIRPFRHETMLMIPNLSVKELRYILSEVNQINWQDVYDKSTESKSTI